LLSQRGDGLSRRPHPRPILGLPGDAHIGNDAVERVEAGHQFAARRINHGRPRRYKVMLAGLSQGKAGGRAGGPDAGADDIRRFWRRVMIGARCHVDKHLR